MQIIKSGYLVSLRTTVSGGVEYSRENREAVSNEGGQAGQALPATAEVSTFVTTKTTFDPKEHEEAIKVRGKAVYTLRKVMSDTPFGFLCPKDNAARLSAAVEEAKSLCKAHNDRAKYTFVGLTCFKALIESNDKEASMAIVQECIAKLDLLSDGTHTASEQRDAIGELVALSTMLDDSLQGPVTAAVEQARVNATIQARKEKGKVSGEPSLSSIKALLDKFLDMGAEAQQEA